MKDFEKISQRELEDYFKTFRECGGNDEKSISECAGACVRALIKLGWHDPIDTDNAKPYEILKEYIEVLKGINKALLPPSKN
jgi:hypothetical protein